ncbi:MAG: translocation/assembly module TamB domain-containing protein [Cyanobacteria bacterium P01_H01_bin.15]
MTRPDDARQTSQKSAIGWRRLRQGLGGALLLGIVGGGVTGWWLLENRLVPFVEQEVSKLLNRPVNLGSLQSWSWQGVTVGASEMPSIPENASFVTFAEGQVRLDWWALWHERTLALNLTLVQPEIYIEQSITGSWLPVKIQSLGDDGPIDIQLETATLQNADITLRSRSQTGELLEAIPLTAPTAIAEFTENYEQIGFELAGTLQAGGDLALSGAFLPETQKITLALQGTDLAAHVLPDLIPLPAEITAGEADGSLTLEMIDSRLVHLAGQASVQAVDVWIPQLPSPITQATGSLTLGTGTVSLSEVQGYFGEIAGQATGELNWLTQSLALAVQTETATVEQAIAALDLPQPGVPLDGTGSAELTISGELSSPVLQAAVQLTETAQVDRLAVKSGAALLTLQNNVLTVEQFQGLPDAGGTVVGQGEIDLATQDFQFVFQGQALPTRALLADYGQTVPALVESFSGSGTIQGNVKTLGDWEKLTLSGTGILGLSSGTVQVLDASLQDGQWRTELAVQAVALNTLHSDLPPLVVDETANAQLTVAGDVAATALSDLSVEGRAEITLAEGTLTVPLVNVENGNWQAQIIGAALPLATLTTELPPNWKTRTVNVQLVAQGTVETLSLDDITIAGTGAVPLPSGELLIRDLQVARGRWLAEVETPGLALADLMATPPAPAQVFSQLILQGSLAELTRDRIQGDGVAQVAIANGELTTETLTIQNGEFQADVSLAGLNLQAFGGKRPELDTELSGELTVSGVLADLSPAALDAVGNVRLNRGLGFLKRPLTADIVWANSQLAIANAQGPGLEAQGSLEVGPDFFQTGTLTAIRNLDLAVDAAQIPLKTLPLPLPHAIARLNYTGDVDYAGPVKGELLSPALNGAVRVHKFALESLILDPVFTGSIEVQPDRQVELALTGDLGSRIDVRLGPDQKPDSFAIALATPDGKAKVTGERLTEQVLQLQTEALPLEPLRELAIALAIPLPERVQTGQLRGKLTGTADVDLQTFATSAPNLVVDQPVFGRLSGEQFSGNLAYARDRLTLDSGRLLKGDSEYEITATLSEITSDLQLTTAIAIRNGEIQDVLEALEIFELSDLNRGLAPASYGTAADLFEPPLPESNSNSPKPDLFAIATPSETPIFVQLQRLTEIQKLRAQLQQTRRARSFLPPLGELSGIFNGQASVQGSISTGLSATFDFQGQGWQWEKFAGEEVVASGSYRNGVFLFTPLSLTYGNEEQIVYSGNFGGDNQSGQLRLENISVDLLDEFVPLPPAIGFGGLINATVSFSGSQNNPAAIGQITVDNATINTTPIATTEGSFSYNNAQLNFFATSQLTADSPPLELSGTFPYQLPLSDVPLASNRLEVDLNIQDEGLKLLDILSNNQVRWETGNANITVNINGRFLQGMPEPLQELTAQGTAVISDAQILSSLLPAAPLTKLNGQILFNFNEIQVSELTADIAGGQVQLMGVLPISPTLNTPETPLTLNLTDIAIDIPNTYQGGVEGEIQVIGNLLQPQLTGLVELTDGIVNLSLGSNSGRINNPLTSELTELPVATEFAGLFLRLGPNVRIQRLPILDLVATGDLALSGSLTNLRPEGTILLRRGDLNLFTTQFRLERDGPNLAQFFPQRGLDPFLDLRLVTTAVESQSTPVQLNIFGVEGSEIPLNLDEIGTLETVRIQANVRGYASQLSENLRLTSSPPRSQTEIISLLGGGFVNTLSQDVTPTGIANLAGSALISPIQKEVANALGLSQFRIFPTPIVDETERTSTIGLAGEAGIDITNRLSASVFKLLNPDLSAQWGLRYRINRNWILGASTNFTQDSRASLEFESRF